MKASRLADIRDPHDAGTLEDELWRSLEASSASPARKPETVSPSPLWQRPFPAPANDRTPPAAGAQRDNPPARSEPANQDIAASGTSYSTYYQPAAETPPASEPIEEPAHRRYDWDCKIADDPVTDSPSRFEKLEGIYQALAARLGWISSVSPRTLALPAAGVVVLGGLVVGMTLLYDPLSDSPEAAPAAEIASAETPKVEAPAEPAPQVVVPQTPSTAQAAVVATPAAPANMPVAAPQPQQAAVTALEVDNERWARTEGEQANAAPAQNPPSATATDNTAQQPEAQAFADQEKTAAISANEQPTQTAAASSEPPAPAAKPQAPASIGKGRITTAVNLRAGPADEAKVLRTIPARATVDIITCKGWCKVAYEGQQGWIYKKFLNRG